MGRLLWGRRYFNKGRHISFVIISPLADFSWERHFNETPASLLTLQSVCLVAVHCCQLVLLEKCRRHGSLLLLLVYGVLRVSLTVPL